MTFKFTGLVLHSNYMGDSNYFIIPFVNTFCSYCPQVTVGCVVTLFISVLLQNNRYGIPIPRHLQVTCFSDYI